MNDQGSMGRVSRGSRSWRGSCALLLTATLATVALGACGATTGQYQCIGSEQCELARRCAPKCEERYSWDDKCARFSEAAPEACSQFVGLGERPDRRSHVKGDPFR